jgi:hypothetical protein
MAASSQEGIPKNNHLNHLTGMSQTTLDNNTNWKPVFHNIYSISKSRIPPTQLNRKNWLLTLGKKAEIQMRCTSPGNQAVTVLTPTPIKGFVCVGVHTDTQGLLYWVHSRQN